MITAQVISLKEDGVTGEFVDEITMEARQTYKANPGSVFAYAVWSALCDLGEYFQEEQGMPEPEWERIDTAVRRPLTKLLEADGLHTENAQAVDALTQLLKGLNSLRVPVSTH